VRQAYSRRRTEASEDRCVGARTLDAPYASVAVAINNVQPGPVDTDLNPATSEFAGMLKKLMALPRYGHVDEVAAMVAYLAGPEADFVTGASLTIDGGFTA
jgi:NAD(P)-dependent dehydrogenase (short-subunit alcohol dehydrogenase family)